MNSLTIDSNIQSSIPLTETISVGLFGLNNRYTLFIFKRDDTVAYAVQDNNLLFTGRQPLIRICGSFTHAVVDISSPCDFYGKPDMGNLFIYNDVPYRVISRHYGESMINNDTKVIDWEKAYFIHA